MPRRKGLFSKISNIALGASCTLLLGTLAYKGCQGKNQQVQPQQKVLSLDISFDLSPLEKIISKSNNNSKADYSKQQANIYVAHAPDTKSKAEIKQSNGIFLSDSGYFITVNHAIKHPDKNIVNFFVYEKDGYAEELALVAYNKNLDIALLRVKNLTDSWKEYCKERGITQISFSNDNKDLVIKALDPEHIWQATPNHNMGIERKLISYPIKEAEFYENYSINIGGGPLVHSWLVGKGVSVPQGTSGSPCYDQKGNIVGILVGVDYKTKDSFMVPANELKSFFQQCLDIKTKQKQ